MATLTLTGVVISPTTAAATTIIDLTKGVYAADTKGIRNGIASIELIGALDTDESVAFEYPLVADPDPTDDADWAQYYTRTTALQLTPTNHSEMIEVPTLFRLNKTATAAAVGVRIV